MLGTGPRKWQRQGAVGIDETRRKLRVVGLRAGLRKRIGAAWGLGCGGRVFREARQSIGWDLHAVRLCLLSQLLERRLSLGR